MSERVDPTRPGQSSEGVVLPPPAPPQGLRAGKVLHWSTLAMAALVLVMLGLGIMIVAGQQQVRDVHGIVGYVLTLVGVVAAVCAFLVARPAGKMGIFFHAVSIPVLMVVQIGLAEMGLKWVHVVLGVLIAIAVGALVPLTKKYTLRAFTSFA